MEKEKYEVIVIGGGPAGVISAITSRKYYSNKKILLIKDVEKGVIPCGIPYMFATLKNPEDNAMGNKPLEANNIDLLIDEVIQINRKNKCILTRGDKEIKYEKLVIATGATSITPKIKGVEKKNVFFVKKEMGFLKGIKRQLMKSKNVVIIGGGFIGVEFADELSKIKNVRVSIVELLPELLGNSFDSEFSERVREELVKKGIKIHSNTKLEEICGRDKAESVLLSNKQKIPADVVIFGIGARPNKSLAEESGIKTGDKGIKVDKCLRTSDENIFAIGDCIEKKNFITKNKENIMLASSATTEARIASFNLFNKKSNKYCGTLASYSTKIGDLALASTGITEKSAKKNKLDVVIGIAESVDKHPEKLPSTSKVKVKLIFSKRTKEIIGGQISGGDSVGEMINIISGAIQNKSKVHELECLQIATHPKLTPAPTSYPIINAAQNAIRGLKHGK